MAVQANSMTTSVAAAWALVCALGHAADCSDAPIAGHAVGGLRIRLELPVTEHGGTPRRSCELTLENVGLVDLNVKLGFSLANGKSHHAAALRLLTRSHGNKTRTFISP
jgi:hypothetical protein